MRDIKHPRGTDASEVVRYLSKILARLDSIVKLVEDYGHLDQEISGYVYNSDFLTNFRKILLPRYMAWEVAPVE